MAQLAISWCPYSEVQHNRPSHVLAGLGFGLHLRGNVSRRLILPTELSGKSTLVFAFPHERKEDLKLEVLRERNHAVASTNRFLSNLEPETGTIVQDVEHNSRFRRR